MNLKDYYSCFRGQVLGDRCQVSGFRGRDNNLLSLTSYLKISPISGCKVRGQMLKLVCTIGQKLYSIGHFSFFKTIPNRTSTPREPFVRPKITLR